MRDGHMAQCEPCIQKLKKKKKERKRIKRKKKKRKVKKGKGRKRRRIEKVGREREKKEKKKFSASLQDLRKSDRRFSSEQKAKSVHASRTTYGYKNLGV